VATKYNVAHQRRRTAEMRAFKPQMPCCLCGHPLSTPAGVELDHGPDGKTYRGLAHGTVACRVCRRKCNRAEAGRRGAIAQGKQLRDRVCVICGTPFVTLQGAATCGQRRCITALRASRKARKPDPVPPQQAPAWVW
jgi:hypothetical protein